MYYTFTKTKLDSLQASSNNFLNIECLWKRKHKKNLEMKLEFPTLPTTLH